MTEDQIYKHIDLAINKIEIVKAVMTLQRLDQNRLKDFYGEYGLEHLMSDALKNLSDAQSDRIPF